MKNAFEHYDNRPKTNPILRLLFMIVLYLLFIGVRTMVLLMAAYQFFSHLITGRVSQRGLRWGDGLSRWIHELMRFLTYNSERMPFPFKAFGKNDEFGG